MSFVRLVPVLGALAFTQACASSPTTPAAAASPSPAAGWPRAKAAASALENLEHVRSLERSLRPDTVLITMFAVSAEFDGTAPAGGGTWAYVFRTPAGRPMEIYQWDVDRSGAVKMFGPVSPIRIIEPNDIGPSIVIDSRAAIEIGMANGGRDYLRLRPDAKPGLTANGWGPGGAWLVRFFASGTCQLGPIEIDARTGEVRTRDLSCTPSALPGTYTDPS